MKMQDKTIRLDDRKKESGSKKETIIYDGLYSYEETCRLAKENGIQPVSNPEPELIDRLKDTIGEPFERVTLLEEDLLPCGIYIYRASGQEDEYYRNSLGVTTDLGDGLIIIGLSFELLKTCTPAFRQVVFLHELGHLCGSEKHDERFQIRLNRIMQEFYNAPEMRNDCKLAQLIYNTLRGWRM